jgi:hypothetical protein
MKTEGYTHMVTVCPGLQAEILSTVAALGGAPEAGPRLQHVGHGGRSGGPGLPGSGVAGGGVPGSGGGGGGGRARDVGLDVDEGRRVRPRRD